MGPLGVVVRGVGGEQPAEVSLAEDQHAVGGFGADGQHEAFGEAVGQRRRLHLIESMRPIGIGGCG
jgi:hypothetical protein